MSCPFSFDNLPTVTTFIPSNLLSNSTLCSANSHISSLDIIFNNTSDLLDVLGNISFNFLLASLETENILSNFYINFHITFH